MGQLSNVREAITGDTEALVKARFYAVIYSEAATNKEPCALRSQISITTVSSSLLPFAAFPEPKQNAKNPQPCAPSTTAALVGELNNQPTGREILETTDSLAPLLPLNRPGLAVHNHTPSVQLQPAT